MVIKNLDLLLADEKSLNQIIENKRTQIDLQAKSEIRRWFDEIITSNENRYNGSLENNSIIKKYAEEGLDSAPFRDLVECVSAFFTFYKLKPIGDNHFEDTWTPEKYIGFTSVFISPVLKKAVDRFYTGNEEKVRDLIKDGLNMIFNYNEQVEGEKLETAFNSIKPWVSYLSPRDIVEAVETPIIANLTSLVTDNSTLEYFQKPTPILGVFDEAIMQEKDVAKKAALVQERDQWAERDKSTKQNNLECTYPEYQSELNTFTRKMSFLKEILGKNYRPEIFKDIMGFSESGDIKTPVYFKRFFEEAQNGI